MDIGHDTGQIFSESHRRDRHGRSEPDCGRDPAGEETDGRVEDRAEEIVLASRAGERCAKLGVGEGAAERADSAHEPERHDREARGQIANLKSEAGEDAGADHVRHHDGRGCERGDGLRATVDPCFQVRVWLSGHHISAKFYKWKRGVGKGARSVFSPNIRVKALTRAGSRCRWACSGPC